MASIGLRWRSSGFDNVILECRVSGRLVVGKTDEMDAFIFYLTVRVSDFFKSRI